MADSKAMNELLASIVKMAAPFIIGALITLWYTSTGDHIQLQQNKEQIALLQTEVAQIKDNYATNKRVDDVVTEMRSGFSSVNSKIDQVIKILVDRSNK